MSSLQPRKARMNAHNNRTLIVFAATLVIAVAKFVAAAITGSSENSHSARARSSHTILLERVPDIGWCEGWLFPALKDYSQLFHIEITF